MSDYSVHDKGYVNIHGHDVKVFECRNTGSILIPIDELKEMGFTLFKKTQYNKFLIDDSQFTREFEIYMLDAAQKYMLQNKVFFREEAVLECINKCKVLLSGKQSMDKQNPPVTSPPSTNFKNSQVVEKSPLDITITTLRQPSEQTRNSIQNENSFKGFTQKSPANIAKYDDYGAHSGFRNKPLMDNNQRSPNSNMQQSRVNGFKPNSNFELKKVSPRESNESLNKVGQPDYNEDEKLPNVELLKTEHDVVVSCIEKPNCVWVHETNSVDLVLDIKTKAQSEAKTAAVLKGRYARNKVYLAEYEDSKWYRCKVIKFKPLTVFFIDYGYITQTDVLKEASEELSSIPCQAVRITSEEYKFEVEKIIHVKILQKFPNGTYKVEVTDKSPIEEPPKIPTFFFHKPEACENLEHNQRVLLAGKKDNSLVLRTREQFDRISQIEKHLKTYEAKVLDKVEKGQFVLCQNEDLVRAIVLNVNPLKVELLDYCTEMQVDISHLRHIDECLAREPVTYILSPPLSCINERTRETVDELIKRKSKARVILDDEDFDLEIIGQELLSIMLSSNRPMIKDFSRDKFQKGRGVYLLVADKSTGDFYIASSNVMEEKLESIMKTGVPDDTPYEPIEGEVCFGLYGGAWSRCVVLKKATTRYEVQFVDFGNKEVLNSDQLRKLTDDAKNVPILAQLCQITNMKPGQEYSEGEDVTLNVKNFTGNYYVVEVLE